MQALIPDNRDPGNILMMIMMMMMMMMMKVQYE